MKIEELTPKLSENLSFHKFSNSEYFIHQKEYGHRIKISNYLKSILNNIDGNTTLQKISEELNNTISVYSLYEVLYLKLGKYGIIENDSIEVTPETTPSYLKLSFIVIPPKIISMITPFLKPLFKPKLMRFLIGLCSIIIVSGLLLNISLILHQNLNDLWVGLFILGFISVTFHEFGHVTAADFFGAEHGGIGGGFYLLTPVYFADVTDIWKLEPKQRIIVNLAGIYFELLMCTLFVIIGYLGDMELLYIAGLVIFTKTLFNLNPFLRSDGYWILTDFTNKPNLLRHSFDKVKDIYRFLKGEHIKWNKVDILLFLYGLTSCCLIGMFIYYVLFQNPNSILHFPVNMMDFLQSIFDKNKEITLAKYGALIIPLMFYYLLFNLVKSVIIKGRK